MDSDAGAYPYPPEQGGHHLILVIFLVLALAAILAAGAAMGLYAARQRGEMQRAAIRKAIYKAVRKALDAALQARGPELVIAARRLIKVTTTHLGPLFAAGKPMSGPIDLINRALNGKIMDTAKPGTPPPQPVHAPSASHPGPQGVSASKDASTVVITPPATITNIHLGGRGPEAKPEAPAKPAERDMTVPEQLEELGKAVEALNRAWQEDAVDAFLAAAQKALLDVRPVDDHDDHGGGHGH